MQKFKLLHIMKNSVCLFDSEFFGAFLRTQFSRLG